MLQGSWDLVKKVIIGVRSPLSGGYPNYTLLITLLTKSHEPLSRP